MLPPSHASQLERGLKAPSLATIEAVAGALRVAPHVLSVTPNSEETPRLGNNADPVESIEQDIRSTEYACEAGPIRTVTTLREALWG